MLTQEQLIAKYGDPGVGREGPDSKWVKRNIIYSGGGGKAERPAMPGVPSRLWFACHRLVEPRMRAAFTAAKAACPSYRIGAAGSFVFRHMRHDVRAPLSWHSWGVAVDIDAAKNNARTFEAGKQPPPWSRRWNELWPNGLPQAFVEAFEAEGFDWGGRWRGFLDNMHFQAHQ